MPRFGSGRPHAAIGLLIVGTALSFVGLQQLSGPVAVTEPTPTFETVQNFQPLKTTARTIAIPPNAGTMNAAVSVGQFEDLVRPTPVPTVAPTPIPIPTQAPEPTPTEAPSVLYETGIASTYGEGDGFEGNRTACGQIFRTAFVQVAHKSLPCGTVVRVEDTNSGMSVVAEVTDRGPYIPGRIVDLSWGAFKELDPRGPGLLRVNVYLLED